MSAGKANHGSSLGRAMSASNQRTREIVANYTRTLQGSTEKARSASEGQKSRKSG